MILSDGGSQQQTANNFINFDYKKYRIILSVWTKMQWRNYRGADGAVCSRS